MPYPIDTHVRPKRAADDADIRDAVTKLREADVGHSFFVPEADAKRSAITAVTTSMGGKAWLRIETVDGGHRVFKRAAAPAGERE